MDISLDAGEDRVQAGTAHQTDHEQLYKGIDRGEEGEGGGEEGEGGEEMGGRAREG